METRGPTGWRIAPDDFNEKNALEYLEIMEKGPLAIVEDIHKMLIAQNK